MKLTKLRNRVLFLSPTVQACWQAESYRTDFQKLKNLGQGSYGTVWKARHKKTDKIYAIKQIKKKNINSKKLLEQISNEVKIMYKLNHPNIIKLYNHFEDQYAIYFILQFAEKGQIYKLMMNSGQMIPQNKVAKYIYEVLLALQCMHQEKIIHRDIKPENVLLDKQDRVKLADFGWSNFIHTTQVRETYCGTLDYLAPEMVDQSHQHDYRVDIWSIGILIYELCTGISPFSHQLTKKNELSEQKVKQNIKNMQYTIPTKISIECYELIRKILQKDPEMRPSLQEIMEHKWIKRYNISHDIKKEKQQWYHTLRDQFKNVLQEIKPIDTNYNNSDNAKSTFTNQEIYRFSRVECIINSKTKNMVINNSNQGLQNLELKIKQLELNQKIYHQKIRTLNKQVKSHKDCQNTIDNLMKTIQNQNQQMEQMHRQLSQNQQKLRFYQIHSKHS